jgi:K+-sensing histidine kinase KdpD
MNPTPEGFIPIVPPGFARILPRMGDEPELARLISLVAHELRTPLSVVSGYLKMLASERTGALTDPQRRAIAGADRACQHLTALASDMSWMGRIERGEVSASRAPLPLAALLREMAATHTPHDEHPVLVEAVVPDDFTITADASHLRRALTTMLAAVVRAAPDHATVQIASARRAPLLLIAMAPAPGVDTLLALDIDTLEPPDESQGGLGVGLPLARRLMALDGGSLHARKSENALALLLALPHALA